MEEDKVKIQRSKNSGRVEWGRKLVKLSKQKKIEIIAVVPNVAEQISGVYKKYYTYGLVIGGTIILLCMYKCKSKN